MTIRPLKLEPALNFLHTIRNHRGDILAKNIKLSKNTAKKLLVYPITAFGYEITTTHMNKYPNPKFDRTDVIKALDFWIEHWVYQNKKDYILEGTVNKDFELTVRELIETREAVLKMPADTEFVRQKIRFELSDELKQEIARNEKEFKDWMIEITENVLDSSNSSAISTVDQFCYVVRKMTYKEYMERQYELYTYNINFFREDGPRFSFGGLDDESSPSIWGGRHSDGVSVRERPPNAAEVASRAQQEGGPDHLLHSNLHPGIPSSTESSALVGKRIKRIDIRLKKQGEPL